MNIFVRLGLFFAFVSFQIFSKVEAGEPGLVIHAAEIGIGKFHRADNKAHPYGENNIWANYVLPENASFKTPLVRENKDGSVTIFFSHLEELLTEAKKVSDAHHKKIDVFNINAHGMPGAMWFPKDESTMNGFSCAQWLQTAQGDDEGNYKQYYSPVSKMDIYQFRILSKLPTMQFMAPCTTGTRQWKQILNRHPDVKSIFSSDAQVHLFSCVVGLGWAGRRFTNNLASLLLKGEGAKVEAAMNFGLGDWSMPEGMGFWDFKNSEQLKRDNSKYPVNKQDREMMQKGQIRLAMFANGAWKSGIISNLDFMLGSKDSLAFSDAQIFMSQDEEGLTEKDQSFLSQMKNFRLRIPRTNEFVEVRP